MVFMMCLGSRIECGSLIVIIGYERMKVNFRWLRSNLKFLKMCDVRLIGNMMEYEIEIQN